MTNIEFSLSFLFLLQNLSSLFTVNREFQRRKRQTTLWILFNTKKFIYPSADVQKYSDISWDYHFNQTRKQLRVCILIHSHSCCFIPLEIRQICRMLSSDLREQLRRKGFVEFAATVFAGSCVDSKFCQRQQGRSRILYLRMGNFCAKEHSHKRSIFELQCGHFCIYETVLN